MKKAIIALSSVIALVLFTGCGKSKVLECSLTQSATGYKMVGTEKITFKGNDVKDYSAEFVMELDEKYLTYKSTFVSAFKTQMNQYKGIDGVELNTKETDDGVKVTMKANVQKMTDDGLKKFDLKKKASYSATKTAREKSGYKCK